MNAASMSAGHMFRPQLLERRARLQAAANSVSAAYLNDLIVEIDAALGRIDNGSYGLCETCHDSIEADRLERNPLVRFCLDHLSPAELQAHQQDLELATQIQSKLLPPRDIALESWDTQYRYEPVGAVGGDYCELIVLGDAKSLFFATLVCGRATANGVELCNAGHCTPLLLRRDVTQKLDSTGLPLGLFCGGEYTVLHLSLGAGESLVLYSDGITEVQDPAGNEYREERLIRSLRDQFEQGANAMADGVERHVARFRQSRPPIDDMTLLIVRRRH